MSGMNVKREDLIERTKAKREEAWSYYSTEVKEWEDAIANIGDSESFKEQMAQWHKDVGQSIENGTVTFTATGKLRGAPDKPKPNTVYIVHTNHGYSHGYTYTREECERQVGHAVSRRRQAVAPYDAAIELLEMSTDETVSIESGDFQRLLGATFR